MENEWGRICWDIYSYDQVMDLRVVIFVLLSILLLLLPPPFHLLYNSILMRFFHLSQNPDFPGMPALMINGHHSPSLVLFFSCFSVLNSVLGDKAAQLLWWLLRGVIAPFIASVATKEYAKWHQEKEWIIGSSSLIVSPQFAQQPRPSTTITCHPGTQNPQSLIFF